MRDAAAGPGAQEPGAVPIPALDGVAARDDAACLGYRRDRAQEGHMEFRDTAEEAAFRARVRLFLDAELPPELGGRPGEWGLFNAGGRMGPDSREAFRGWT